MTGDVNPKPAPGASSSPCRFDEKHDSHIIVSDGAVAQLGERIPRTDEVRGSNPLGSTTQCRASSAAACATSLAVPLLLTSVYFACTAVLSQVVPTNVTRGTDVLSLTLRVLLSVDRDVWAGEEADAWLSYAYSRFKMRQTAKLTQHRIPSILVVSRSCILTYDVRHSPLSC